MSHYPKRAVFMVVLSLFSKIMMTSIATRHLITITKIGITPTHNRSYSKRQWTNRYALLIKFQTTNWIDLLATGSMYLPRRSQVQFQKTHDAFTTASETDVQKTVAVHPQNLYGTHYAHQRQSSAKTNPSQTTELQVNLLNELH